MMNEYNINGNLVSSNLKRNEVTTISAPLITYPYSFTNQIRKITQQFITGSDNVPAFDPHLKHPTFNTALLIAQKNEDIEITGFTKFTREYLEFTSTSVVAVPSTISFSYPSIYVGTNYNLRSQNSEDQDTDQFSYAFIRQKTLTKNVPVEERWELIDVGSPFLSGDYEDQVLLIGSEIQYGGYTWEIRGMSTGGITLTRVEDFKVISLNIIRGDPAFNFEPDFSRLTDISKFNVKDTYNTSYINSVYRNRVGSNEIEDLDLGNTQVVDFVDNATSPTTEEYLELVKNKSKVPLADSTITHIGGYAYIRKTKYGILQ
jgi:hypothetical protein